MVKVVISDAHPVARIGIRAALEPIDQIEIVGEAGDGPSTISLVQAVRPDVITLGLTMPGIRGMELIRFLKAGNPALRILVATRHSEQPNAIRAFRAGASGFITKSSPRQEFVDAVTKVAAGGIFVSTTVVGHLAQSINETAGTLPHLSLSSRELDVLVRIVSGQPQTAIANALGVSTKTISTHRTRILEKMNLSNDAALVRYAVLHALVEDEF